VRVAADLDLRDCILPDGDFAAISAGRLLACSFLAPSVLSRKFIA
jgi:hypothetical protein